MPPPVRVAVAVVFINMLSYAKRVVNSYMLYQHFLTNLQNTCHDSRNRNLHRLSCDLQQRKQENLTHARNLLRLSCEWKGGRNAPDRQTLVNVCALKQIPTDGADSKFEIYKRLIFRLKQELLSSNVNALDDLLPQTPQAVELHAPQVDVKIRAPTVDASPWTRLATVGAKHFQDICKYRAYIKTGKHAAHASPCVARARIDWNHPIIFEEWMRHKAWQGTSTCR